MEDNKMAKLTVAEMIEAIKELSVLELNDLVKACEEEFGVSAAAGVVVAAAGAGEAAVAEEKDEFDVELTSAGASKVKVIKVVREITGLGLKEAKEVVDGAPKVIKEQADKAVAEDITARKDELGFAAFSSAGLDGSSSWRFSGHLANMPLFYEFRDDKVTAQPATVTGKYLDNYKNLWDLYINNATCAPSELSTKTGDESEAEFGRGEAVFFQNGSWEYGNLVGEEKFTDDDLAMSSATPNLRRPSRIPIHAYADMRS